MGSYRATAAFAFLTPVADTLDSQAQKFGSLHEGHESEDELGEHSLLLETPLEKLEPYQIFRTALLSKSRAWTRQG